GCSRHGRSTLVPACSRARPLVTRHCCPDALRCNLKSLVAVAVTVAVATSVTVLMLAAATRRFAVVAGPLVAVLPCAAEVTCMTVAGRHVTVVVTRQPGRL